jgi:hypothetical protein
MIHLFHAFAQVNLGGRPFMGPNLYMTPPGSYTTIHQDGHGTVDSGHLCLMGYNEVVMLRRLSEIHKKHAIRILNGKDFDNHDDALYGYPHAESEVSSRQKMPPHLTLFKLNDISKKFLMLLTFSYLWLSTLFAL